MAGDRAAGLDFGFADGGVDIGAKAGIFQIVDTLAARGLAILLISDEADEILHQSHRILVMREGKIVGPTIRRPSVRKRCGKPFMPEGGSFLKGAFRRHEVQIASIVVVMAVLFSALSPAFASGSNLITLLESYSVMAIMAAGLLVVLISGGIDISFAAIAAVSQYVVATILVQWGGNWAVAFALAVLFGGLLGVVNALLIHYLQALSVIVTISTMTFYFAILMFVTDGRSIYDLPDWFTATIAPLGIPFPVVVAGVVLVLTAVLLKGSPLGGRSMGWEATWKGQAHGVQPGGPAVLCLRLLGSDGGDSGVGAGASGGGSGAQCAHWARARRVGGGGFRWASLQGALARSRERSWALCCWPSCKMGSR